MDSVSDKSAVGRKVWPAADEYGRRLVELSATQASERRTERLLGITKLVIAAATVIAAGFVFHNAYQLGLLLIPVAAFVILAVRQEKLLNAIRARERSVRFYERGVARLEARWSGTGATGDRFLDATHPYARDLDIFGSASVFEYVSSARTQAGEETLARWLLEAAPLEETVARQAAVRDLAGRVRFREKLWSMGEPVREGVRPDALAEWGERGPVLTSATTRIATTGLALLFLLSLVVWVKWGWPAPALLMSLVNFAYAHLLYARLERAAAMMERAADDLRLLSGVLALLEHERFDAPKLVSLRASLERDGIAPCVAIRRLARIVEVIESRHSLFARPLDWMTFWSAQLVFRAERWQHRFGPALRGWIAAAGELEALASLSSLSFEHPEYAFPAFVAEGPLFDAEGIAHPLLPAGKAVENDVLLDESRQLMILSGPNMAGKSTFIRCIGVNAVLAQCGAPVCARNLRMSRLCVAASICILDSLSGGVSRFYAEIRRLKMIAELAEAEVPVLFLLDELLSGTNSHDRFIGTQFVLRTLVERHAIGVASTHDLALTQIPDSLPGAMNVHFSDRLEGDKLVFDYKLQPGPVQTSNALKLMRAIGLGVTE